MANDNDEIETEEEAEIDFAFAQYIPETLDEYRRLWCLTFAHAVCPSFKDLKQAAMWAERYLKDGTGGPIG